MSVVLQPFSLSFLWPCYRTGVSSGRLRGPVLESVQTGWLIPFHSAPSQEKCAQYWPTQEEHDMTFRDTRFKVTLVSEDVKSYYTTRVLELQNITVSISL